MFEFEETPLLGQEERSIVVQTQRGTNLTNVISPPPTAEERRYYQEGLLRDFGARWVARRPPTGGYNCAGHVWASRRTTLSDPEEWRLILKEDGYRQLANANDLVPDDIVVYVDRATGEVLHVCRVTEMQQGITPDSERIARVVSKWGSKGGEAIHFVYDVPFRQMGYQIAIQYWTDRRMDEDG